MTNLPSAINWARSDCDHGVRMQQSCNSCWAFAVAGMLSDRCCKNNHDHGWLSAQELVSCDNDNHHCNGGAISIALQYVRDKNGLVTEKCFPYKAQSGPCRTTCIDDSAMRHYCNCPEKETPVTNMKDLKAGLASGPVILTIRICRSFHAYGGGDMYKCDCESKFEAYHTVICYGYNEQPTLSIECKNSWGVGWGNKGYFKIDPNTCKLPIPYPKLNFYCNKVEP